MLIRIAELFARRAWWVTVFVAALVGVSASLTGWASTLDESLDHVRHSLSAKHPSGNTVIVEIDSRSLREVHSWPWPRSIHARAVDRLSQAGANRIVFDIDFTSPAADPAQDLAFGAAIERAPGRVVLAGVLDNVDGEYGQRTEVLPAPSLRRSAEIGALWIRLDSDFVARRIPYSVEIAGGRRPSLAAWLADQPSQQPDSFPLDWSFDPAEFPSISYADLLAGRYPADFFRGKNVIIGGTATTLGDRFSVPSWGRVPGLFIQAVGSETLRQGQPILLGPWPAVVLTLALIFASLIATRPSRRFSILIATAATAAIVPLVMREFTPYVIEAAPAVAAALVAIVLAIAAAITSAALARVTLAPVSHLPNLTAMCMSGDADSTTVAVRLRNHVETTALLGSEGQGELLRRVADRIALAASDSRIFQVDDHSFAWRTRNPVSAIADAIEGLHALLASGITVGDRTVDVTIAVGISDDAALGTEAAVAAAMAAASRADRRGLNWERYEADDDDDADWRLSLLNELDKAIDQGDVWVAYQPKFDLKAASICGAEALVRWSHPLRGDIRPDQFIPTLEDNGRIEKLTLHVLESAIRDFAPLDENLTIAVNISAKMIGRNRLLEPIRDMLAAWNMDARRLTLEITESAALAGSAGVEELNSLRALGVHISIDDYGTGQSTLSYLKTLPATELKIDRSFVQLIASSRSDAAVVDSTVKLAHALGLTVVAEGVESEEVLNLLRQMNCDMVQGYYVGEPGSIQGLINRLSVPNQLRAARRR
jgi:EAL domain-containing protein (putative c-di-GMP-specific phosphodiesterase class I)/CHASE2 domain-containing sensor protein